MSDVADLWDGGMPVRMVPLVGMGRPVDLLTPRLLPPRFEALDPAPPSAGVVVDRWRQTGWQSVGRWTAEQWIRTFGVDLPEDTDPHTFEVPVVLLRYRLEATS